MTLLCLKSQRMSSKILLRFRGESHKQNMYDMCQVTFTLYITFSLSGDRPRSDVAHTHGAAYTCNYVHTYAYTHA